MRTLRWIIKAIVSLLVNDDSAYPRVQVTYNGKPTNALRMSLYGLSAHPPEDALAILLAPDGRLDDPVALVDDPLRRFKGLQRGEVVVGNYLTGSSVKFAADGSVEVSVADGGRLAINVPGGTVDLTSSGNVNLTAPNVNVNGNLIVTGTITGQTDVLGGPLGTSLSTHTHPDPVSGSTGPPN